MGPNMKCLCCHSHTGLPRHCQFVSLFLANNKPRFATVLSHTNGVIGMRAICECQRGIARRSHHQHCIAIPADFHKPSAGPSQFGSGMATPDGCTQV
jgi:hypothetical protein